jgi:hypothetical protein
MATLGEVVVGGDDDSPVPKSTSEMSALHRHEDDEASEGKLGEKSHACHPIAQNGLLHP